MSSLASFAAIWKKWFSLLNGTPGHSTTLAPYDYKISIFSYAIPLGTVTTTFIPLAAPIIAKAIPVFPPEAS